jgi:hypothetical protein
LDTKPSTSKSNIRTDSWEINRVENLITEMANVTVPYRLMRQAHSSPLTHLTRAIYLSLSITHKHPL